MSNDLYVKDKLSNRKKQRSPRFALILAVILILIAAILAFVFTRSQTGNSKQSEKQEESARESRESGSDSSRDKTSDKEGSAQNPDQNIVKMLREGKALAEEDELVDARDKLLNVLEISENSVVLERARKLLNEINPELLLNPRPMPGKEEYEVKSGDTLDKIARKFGVNVALIQKSNNISGHIIRAGQRLHIPSADFNITVDISDNILTVEYNGEYFKRYRVGTGEHDKTPTGKTKVTDRIAQPTWWKPDGKAIPYGSPDNLLGTHWLALDIRGYGIHGTWEPETIGKHESDGCIRLLNEEIEELYTIIPTGTPVTIEK